MSKANAEVASPDTLAHPTTHRHLDLAAPTINNGLNGG
jgi:hypothetical protein